MGIISTLNDQKEFDKIHQLNRVQLIDDAFTFSKVGEMDYGITFQLIKYLKHEKDYMPWMAAMNGLAPINKLMKRTPNQGVFQVSRTYFGLHCSFIQYSSHGPVVLLILELHATYAIARV